MVDGDEKTRENRKTKKRISSFLISRFNFIKRSNFRRLFFSSLFYIAKTQFKSMKNAFNQINF